MQREYPDRYTRLFRTKPEAMELKAYLERQGWKRVTVKEFLAEGYYLRWVLEGRKK